MKRSISDEASNLALRKSLEQSRRIISINSSFIKDFQVQESCRSWCVWVNGWWTQQKINMIMRRPTETETTSTLRMVWSGGVSEKDNSSSIRMPPSLHLVYRLVDLSGIFYILLGWLPDQKQAHFSYASMVVTTSGLTRGEGGEELGTLPVYSRWRVHLWRRGHENDS